jgi:hypothetical protein
MTTEGHHCPTCARASEQLAARRRHCGTCNGTGWQQEHYGLAPCEGCDAARRRELFARVGERLVVAQRRYPGNRWQAYAIAGELAELRAAFAEGPDRVREEAIDVAVCALRVALDGDADHGRPPTLAEWQASRREAGRSVPEALPAGDNCESAETSPNPALSDEVFRGILRNYRAQLAREQARGALVAAALAFDAACAAVDERSTPYRRSEVIMREQELRAAAAAYRLAEVE